MHDPDIANRFTYHPPTQAQVEKYQRIRDAARVYAELLADECPRSRELSTALTHLDTVVFFANASIARNPTT